MAIKKANFIDSFNYFYRTKKFDEKLSKFYASQVVMAFEYLHRLSLIYRDLKPGKYENENI